MDQPGLGLGLVHKKVISICGLFSTSSGPLGIGARGASVAECRMHLLVLPIALVVLLVALVQVSAVFVLALPERFE